MGLRSVLHGGPVGVEEVMRVRETVVFEAPELGRKLVRFFILLMLAAAIATFGLIGDSVATVIGAMIVAPLMLPIMGLAFSISLGDGRAILKSLGMAAGGVVTAIAVGWILRKLTGATFDPEQNGQIMARTAPGLVDMLAALATGLAGAFAIGRKDISDTLPGVAIAISLVPPLANAGILLSLGRSDLAMGSFLLFVTNYVAIVLTGSIVFGLLGYPQAAFVGKTRRSKRLAVAVVVVMFLIMLVPLGARSLLNWAQYSAVGSASAVTKKWLEGSGYNLVSVELQKATGGIEVVISGSGTVPAQADLEKSLVGKVFGLDVVVEVMPSERITIKTR
jgi:uncharacterized hydrophobic protein (TIGR00271 family)